MGAGRGLGGWRGEGGAGGNQKHHRTPEKGNIKTIWGSGAFLGLLFHVGGGDAPSGLAGMRDSDQTALAWNPCRLPGSRVPGLTLPRWGAVGRRGPCLHPSPAKGGVLSVGPHLDPPG